MNDRYALTERTVGQIRKAAEDAEYVLLTASNGLDMAEGLNIFQPNAHFYQHYSDFAQRYGLSYLLQGLFVRWPSEESRWAFLARLAKTEWLDYEPTQTMRRALALVMGKPHFVVTCNFDGRLVKAGVEEDRILETEGTIRKLACSAHCTDELYPAAETYQRLADATHECEAPRDLVPTCPHCGAPLEPAIDERRALRPDAEYRKARVAFDDFLAQVHGHRLLVVELGIGARNQAIKAPSMRLVAQEPKATYVTFNYSEVSIPREIADRSIGVSGDLSEAMQRIVPEA